MWIKHHQQVWIRYVDERGWDPPPPPTPPKAVWGLRATLQSLSGIKNILNDEFTWGKFTFVFFRKRHTPNSQKLITNSFPLVYFLDLFCLVTGHFFYNQEHNSITYLKEGRISFARAWSKHIRFVAQKYWAIWECVHLLITDEVVL